MSLDKTFNFNKPPSPPLVLSPLTCPPPNNGVNIKGKLEQSEIVNDQYELSVRFPDGSLATVFAPINAVATYVGGSTSIANVAPGDSLQLNLIPDPTQAGYYQLGKLQDFDVARANRVSGVVDSSDPSTMTLVVTRPSAPPLTVLLSDSSAIVLPDGSSGTFSDLSPGTTISASGAINKRVHRMFDVTSVQVQ